jgi:hypothetical protein
MKLFVFLSISLLTCVLRAREFHVSDAVGDDSNQGTSSAPLKTLGAASARLTPGDVCIVHGGIYREVLRPAASGDAGRAIIYRAATGAQVTISASDPVLSWTSDADGVFKADLAQAPLSNWVFHGGKRMTEARWPNAGDADFIDSPKATVDEVFATPAVAKGKDGVIDAELPDGMPATWLEGARMWYMHWYNGWSASTLPVSDFDPVTKRVTLAKMIAYSDRPVRSGLKFTYVLQGPRALLDADNEWAHSAKGKTLYLRVPGGASPALRGVEVATREVVADLRDRRFVQLENITFVGGRVLMDEETADCRILNARILYSEKSVMAGARNEIRDSEIAFSQSLTLRISGERNLFVNNHLHDLAELGDGYAVWLAGKEHLVAYNTFERAGQYLLNISTVDHCQVVHNFFRDASLIARDSGSIYSLMNGGNTEIAYNRFMTDYRRLKHVNGIYIDGRGSHFIIHHNVLPIIAANPSKPNVLYYHNTVYRYLDYSTHDDSDKIDPADRIGMEFLPGGDFAGDQFQNNLFAFVFKPFPGLMHAGNLSLIKPTEVFADNSGRRIDQLEEPWDYDFTLRAGSPAVDAGVSVPGVNEDFTGKAPDVGAYEAGRPAWRAGHDFTRPPEIAFSRPAFAFANLIKNPGFEIDQLSGWAPTGTRTVKFQKGNFSWGNEKLDVWSHYGGARLGSGANGLEQEITGLTAAGRYLLWGWVKLTSPEQTVSFGLRRTGGRPEQVQTLSRVTGWVRLLATVDLPANPGRLTVFVKKTSGDAGAVFFDEASLTRLWPVAPSADTPAGVTRFKAVEDTYVHAAEPDQVFGYRSEALLKQSPGNADTDRRPYFKFDLRGIKQRPIKKATLRLYLSTVYSAGLPAISVNAVDDERWTSRGPAALTWNSQPPVGSQIAIRPARVFDPQDPSDSIKSQHGWMTFDITDYVRARLAHGGLVALSLNDPEESGRFAGFATSQLMMSPPFQTYPPSLDIEF